MFPNRYPGNLDCEWRISAEEGQQVQITFHSVATERNFDVVQVIDGPCWDRSSVMATISGKQAKNSWMCSECYNVRHLDFMSNFYPFPPISSPTGDLGIVDVTFRSLSPSLCVRFTTDGETSLSGFNATYTKLYNNTSLPGKTCLNIFFGRQV